jgi:hypothetical protein
MKYKVAVCKIHMIGEPALVLGFCHYDDEDEWWDKYQYFTMENYLEAGPWCNTYPELLEMAKARKKYQGSTVHFDSINKDVKIFKSGHEFSFGEADPTQITKVEWELLSKELTQDGWGEFDWETWGK